MPARVNEIDLDPFEQMRGALSDARFCTGTRTSTDQQACLLLIGRSIILVSGSHALRTDDRLATLAPADASTIRLCRWNAADPRISRRIVQALVAYLQRSAAALHPTQR